MVRLRLLFSFLPLFSFVVLSPIQALAKPQTLRVSLIGCGARMGRISFWRADGFQEPLGGCAFIKGLDYLPLPANKLTCTFTAEPGTPIRVNAYRYSLQASDRFWGVQFQSFSGQCSGQGELFPEGTSYKCDFTMPTGGTFLNLQFETSFGEPGNLPGELCGTPPPEGGGSSGSGGGLSGAALVNALGNAGYDLYNSLGLGGLLKGATLQLNVPASKSGGTVTLSLSNHPMTPGQRRAGGASTVLVASARKKIKAKTPTTMTMKLTRAGKAYLKGKSSAKLFFVASFDPRTPSTAATKSKTKRITLR